jgi:hypothetical protein
MNVAMNILDECDKAQIRIEISGPNELNYVCPKGALTKDLKKQIIQFKPSIIEYLSDVDKLIAAVCEEYSITRDWLDQFVICPEDVEDIKSGDLPLSCLKAHIEYHLEEQRKWQERNSYCNPNEEGPPNTESSGKNS